MTTERERFEAWYAQRYGAFDGTGAAVRASSWAAWQAALAQPAQPVALTFTLREAEELLHMFGGEQGEITVRRLPEGAIKAEDGDPNPSPAGLYGHMTEYPEEGCVYLGPVDVLDDYEPEYTYRAPQPAPVAERSTDGAGAESGDTSGRCAEGAPVRLPDKGSAAGSEAASARSPTPPTLSTAELSDEDRPKRDAWVVGTSYEASMLRNLLARIHGDGGHYLEKHGLEKALDDADQLVAEWRAGRATVEEDAPTVKMPCMYRSGCRSRGECQAMGRCNGPGEVYDAARGKP